MQARQHLDENGLSTGGSGQNPNNYVPAGATKMGRVGEDVRKRLPRSGWQDQMNGIQFI